MSHDGSWRAACLTRNGIRTLHLETPSVARGVTAPGVGSGALLGMGGAREVGLRLSIVRRVPELLIQINRRANKLPRDCGGNRVRLAQGESRHLVLPAWF
jgi:hypothetical protein